MIKGIPHSWSVPWFLLSLFVAKLKHIFIKIKDYIQFLIDFFVKWELMPKFNRLT